MIRTTTETFAAHCRGIPLEHLPKTFQDAIVVVKSIGFRYLWIDSLCIIRDDAEDWRREAARMGSVYSNAVITIAATGARDRREGLFLKRPDSDEPVEIPFKGSTIQCSLHPHPEYGNVDNSPLDKRVWITQEWLLSKRMVHYTQARMIWSCATLSKGEDGERVYSLEAENLRGFLADSQDVGIAQSTAGFHYDRASVVRSYCSRSLTYPTDKPVAIQGPAERLSCRQPETYAHGLWFARESTDFVSSQLLWFCKPPRMGHGVKGVKTAAEGLSRPEALRYIPSWSWQSTIGHIAFHEPAHSANTMLRNVHLNGSTMQMEAILIPLCETWGPVLVDTPLNERWPFSSHFSSAAFASGAATLPHGLYLLGQSFERKGWVSFDQYDIPDGDTVCCVVSSNSSTNGSLDGVNVLLLQLSGGHYARVGFGELLIDSVTLDNSRVSICVI